MALAPAPLSALKRQRRRFPSKPSPVRGVHATASQAGKRKKGLSLLGKAVALAPAGLKRNLAAAMDACILPANPISAVGFAPKKGAARTSSTIRQPWTELFHSGVGLAQVALQQLLRPTLTERVAALEDGIAREGGWPTKIFYTLQFCGKYFATLRASGRA